MPFESSPRWATRLKTCLTAVDGEAMTAHQPASGLRLAAIVIGMLTLAGALVVGQTERSNALTTAQDEHLASSDASGPTGDPSPSGHDRAGRAARTFRVATAARFQIAVTKARPGDTIRITRTITAPLNYQGSKAGPQAGNGRSGRSGSPIVITADPGVWIDPGNVSNGDAALDIAFVNHIHVVDVRVRNSQFGIRFQNVAGSRTHPVMVANNTITEIGEVGMPVIGDYMKYRPSRFFEIVGNSISRTGKKAGFGEGIYLGTGAIAWVDKTSDIAIRDNEIFEIPSEAIDIKPMTRRITVERNRIHDIWPHNSAAIMAIYTNGAPNPRVDIHSEIVVRDNRIWNINLADVPSANDRAIWVGHGGVEVTGNVIWGMRDDQAYAEAIVVYSPAPFGPHPVVIRDNVLWARGGMEIQSGDAQVERSGNVGPRGSANVRAVNPSYFVGPIPEHGTASSADSGAGPGSAFQPKGSR
jgi:hypothetical protein